MSFVADLRVVLREPNFNRLYGTRLVSQASDGIFQASLASAVFFNPERSTDAGQAAAGFAVLLLPYSVAAPFAGVFLDRWRRQRVLVVATVVRAAIVSVVALLTLTVGPGATLYYVAALAAVSVNRFFLAALSASLPHVVRRSLLVMGNSVSTTSGYLATLTGGGIGLAVRSVAGSGDRGSAVIALAAACGYLGSSAVAAGFPNADLLGPDERRPLAAVATAAREVLVGLREGVRHVLERRRAAYALAAIAAHRFFYGISTIATLLLYRNYFSDSGFFRAGIAGLGQVLLAGGVGVVLAAAVTPPVTQRIGKERWMAALFALASVVEVVLGFPYTKPAVVGAAFFLGFAAQAAKICVDTILQESVEESVRGRVFSFYDTLFNLTFVAAAVAGAFVLPATGRSYAVLATIATGYAATSAGYAAVSRRRRDPAPVPSA
jgi:MFS family permease